MPKLDLLTIKGEKDGVVDLPKEIFGAKVNPKLMAQAVRVYLSNQRKAGAKTKTRGEVDRTKAKWYRQKHTGRARHGARSAPIFVGGGKAHGPKGIENYQLKMSKKMKQAALFSALTSQLKDKKILAIKGLDKMEPKTKKMAQILARFKSKKATIVLPGKLDNLMRAARNIKGVKLVQANTLNTFNILSTNQLIFLPESIDKLKEVYLKK